ncbi:MAG: hypothetical protein ACREUE_12520 [Panacagrimonas sp.]
MATTAAAADCVPLLSVPSVLEIDQRERLVQRYEDQRVPHAFALHAYRSIADDVLRGTGEYLDAMSWALDPAACLDRRLTRNWLRELLQASPSIADFARRAALAAHHRSS